MALGYFTGDNAPDSYESLERRKKIAEALIQQGTSTAPIGHWTQGAARLVQAISGALERDRVGKQEQSSSRLLAQILTGGSGASSSPAPSMGGAPAPKPSPSTAMTTGDATGGDMGRFRDAIASIESKGSGDYAAVGPTHPKYGRALGRYQVMEANIGPWSEAALGRRVSPEEFLKNPQLQDAIFDHRFGEYVKKYGNPQDAASAWFTGRPLAQGGNARDSLGTSGSQYVQKFAAALGGGAPVQVASAGGATAYAPNAIAQALTPQAQAPATQAPPAQQMAQAPMPQPQGQGQGQGQGDMAQRLQAVLMDPRFSPQQKQMALQMFQLQQKDEGVSPVDLGDRIALINKRGQIAGYLPKERGKTFGPIGQDQYGNNQYGFIDQRAGTITPVQLPTAASPEAPASAPGAAPGAAPPSMPPPPAGVNPKIWRDEWTREQVRGGPKMTEGESNANAFVNRMIEADRVLNQYEAEGTSQWNSLGKIPILGPRLIGEGAQLYDQAKRAFVNSVLRKESGATITPEEFSNAEKQYFPQPGEGPKVIAQKRAARQTAIEGMKTAAGKGFKEVVPKQDALSGDGDWQEIDGVKIRRVK